VTNNPFTMPRPSQQLDQALLRSGRALYPVLGSAGLSQRRLAEHAGVSPGMFHYHFASKDEFLRTLLQQLYEEMYAPLAASAGGDGPPLDRLQRALFGLAGFVREHRPLLVRLALDAGSGHAVVLQFLRDNAPRHLGVLLRLLKDAERAGHLKPLRHPLQRMALLMGTVVAPLLMAPAVAALGVAVPGPSVETQVCSDAAIGARIAFALAALRGEAPPAEAWA
jgi:AcrR family transcriptional regulator